MNKETFKEITALKNFANIDELRGALEEADWFSPEFLANALQHAKNQAIRSEMKKHKDKDGMPKFVSVTRINDRGEEERVYKQESLFDYGDYKQVIDDRCNRIRHFRDEIRIYRERAHEKFGKWIQLPFDFTDKTKKATR